MQRATGENGTAGLFVTHNPYYDCLYISVCVNVHIYVLYIYVYISLCVLSFHVFLWAEDGIKSSRELHNPINSHSGEVIYLIWVRTAKSSMRICDIDVIQMWEFLGLQLLAVAI